MSDLTGFLLARIAEDEAMARKVQGYCEPHSRIEIHLSRTETLPDGSRSGTHETVTPYDPDRVLAECEAKRRIVEEVLANPLGKWKAGERSPWADKMLGILAAPYADHPDYREEWAL
jgi:hypothetical protein